MSVPLTSFERAARLFKQAEKLGCDTPTESMIADAIQDAEFDTLHNPEIIAERHGDPRIAKRFHTAIAEFRAREGNSVPSDHYRVIRSLTSLSPIKKCPYCQIAPVESPHWRGHFGCPTESCAAYGCELNRRRMEYAGGKSHADGGRLAERSQMNRLSTEDRTRAIACLVEGNSQRATCRMTGLAKKTVGRLAVEIGEACERFADNIMRDLPCTRIQCDEIWSFCYSKQKNVPNNENALA